MEGAWTSYDGGIKSEQISIQQADAMNAEDARYS